MKIENMDIMGIPAIILGEDAENAYLFIHGKNGCKEEALQFADIACHAGFQVVGIDLPEHGSRKNGKEKLLPWVAAPEIRNVFEYMSQKWRDIGIRANSIGAWLSMQALVDKKIGKALFVSPVVDMENLIENMMTWAGVTESDLKQKREIQTGFGETLSWDYLCWVREHKAAWSAPTEILYAEKDNLTSREVIDAFAKTSKSRITLAENCEHWFHTREQLEILREWEERYVVFGS